MKNFRQLKNPDFATVMRLQTQLRQHPELWNERRERIDTAPFVDTDDIWLRANDDRPFRDGKKPWPLFTEPHWSIWYPAAGLLLAVKPLVYQVMAAVNAEHLGGVLITRIPAGGSVKPHKDTGWHATFHNCKVYVPIHSNNQCWNITNGERINMETGEAWTFNNLVQHSVHNKGTTERVTLIISMRVDE